MDDKYFNFADLVDANRNKERDVGKLKKLKPAVTIGYRCEVCNRIFARKHPKDPETKCEKCRKEC